MRTLGKYRLVELIASGGMADVWRAETTGAEGVVKEVALKLVRGDHAARGDFVRMFVREARLASRLGHANVVQVFEFDQIDGTYCIAMELVRGHHLGAVAARAKQLGLRLGIPRAVHVAAEVAKGLAHAHRLAEHGRPVGLVHRDVSPHNVLVSFEGEVKLADFGIARAMDRAGLTEPGQLKGKVAYMAPEQARGDPVDARADVFSLGVVLWELCTGRRLLARDSDAATLAAVLGDEAISPPSAWNDEVPPELDAAVLAALERDPARRTSSAQDLAGALAAVLLDVTRSPADVDLRAFMHGLFEAEIATAHAAPAEPTKVRPVPVAAEPVAGPTPDGDAEDGATRTVVARAPRRLRSVRRMAAGIAIAAGTAAAIAGAVAVGRARIGSAPREETRGAGETARGTGTAITGGTGTATGTRTTTGTTTTTTIAPTTGNTTGNTTTTSAAAVPPPAATAAPAPARPIETAPELNALALPRRASGEGILSVNATPWGIVRVNGFAVGETPQEMRLPAGAHRVRIERKGQRAVEVTVAVKAGARTMLLR